MGGDPLPFLSVRDATVHFGTGKKKNKMKFGFLALLVCHTKAAFGGAADCAPRATLVQPFPLSPLLRYPESSTEEQWVPRGCRGMSEQLEAAISTGWSDEELALRR